MTIVLNKKPDDRSKPSKKRSYGMFNEHVSINAYTHKKFKVEVPVPAPYVNPSKKV